MQAMYNTCDSFTSSKKEKKEHIVKRRIRWLRSKDTKLTAMCEWLTQNFSYVLA